MAPLLRAAVAVVAQVAAVLLVAAVRPVVLLEVVEGRARPAHKRLPLVLLQVVRPQVAVLLAPRRVALPPEAEVAAPLLGQGLAASESLGRQ